MTTPALSYKDVDKAYRRASDDNERDVAYANVIDFRYLVRGAEDCEA